MSLKLLQWGEQLFIATDQWVNVAVSILWGGSGGWADETLSSRIYRSARDGKRVGRILMPPIDFVFGLWQGPEHCRNAYVKERARSNLPPEFRETA